MRSSGFEPDPAGPHDGFVVVDPEGYYLEFERFNPHEENTELMPVLDGIEIDGVRGDVVAVGGEDRRQHLADRLVVLDHRHRVRREGVHGGECDRSG